MSHPELFEPGVNRVATDLSHSAVSHSAGAPNLRPCRRANHLECHAQVVAWCLLRWPLICTKLVTARYQKQ